MEKEREDEAGEVASEKEMELREVEKNGEEKEKMRNKTMSKKRKN